MSVSMRHKGMVGRIFCHGPDQHRQLVITCWLKSCSSMPERYLPFCCGLWPCRTRRMHLPFHHFAVITRSSAADAFGCFHLPRWCQVALMLNHRPYTLRFSSAIRRATFCGSRVERHFAVRRVCSACLGHALPTLLPP